MSKMMISNQEKTTNMSKVLMRIMQLIRRKVNDVNCFIIGGGWLVAYAFFSHNLKGFLMQHDMRLLTNPLDMRMCEK